MSLKNSVNSETAMTEGIAIYNIIYYQHCHTARDTRNTQNAIFRPSKITNFVQLSNFRPNLVQLLKGIEFANGQKIFPDFQVCINKCSISLYYSRFVSLNS